MYKQVGEKENKWREVHKQFIYRYYYFCATVKIKYWEVLYPQ